MKNDILLSIVIVTWNTKAQTVDCINSIINSEDYKTLNGRIELIVIDNNSSDNTSSYIENNFPEVRLIINNKNMGYAPSCNQGMKTSTGEYILLLGSDTIIRDNSLLRCVRFLDEHLNCGAVGCKLFFPDGSDQGNCKKFPGLFNAVFMYLSLNFLNKDYDMQWFNYDKTI
jgi:hypothetical protein